MTLRYLQCFPDDGSGIGNLLVTLGRTGSQPHCCKRGLHDVGGPQASRTIAPSFETLGVVLKNGKVLYGIKVEETDRSITLVDSQLQKYVVNLADIEGRQVHPTSTMPEGLEKRLTEDEFVDLISYLANLKEGRARD
jgi:putative heme-binding domain-containing protein